LKPRRLRRQDRAHWALLVHAVLVAQTYEDGSTAKRQVTNEPGPRNILLRSANVVYQGSALGETTAFFGSRGMSKYIQALVDLNRESQYTHLPKFLSQEM
jgi:hypothetical protein